MNKNARPWGQGTWAMGVPASPNDTQRPAPMPNYAQYSAPSASVTYSNCYYNNSFPSHGNPYVATTPVSAPASSSSSVPMDKVIDVFDRCGKALDQAARKVENYVANLWQHLKIGPSLVDTAMGRIAQGTKLLTEGGHENVFRHNFDVFPGEKLEKSYACYLSTSAGPVIGTLYLSNMRLAFCSDNPLAYNPSPGQTEWSYYKVTVPFYDLRAVNPSANRMNPSERYIQVITAGGHEFWFMGFVTYDKALKHLQDVVRQQAVESPVTQ